LLAALVASCTPPAPATPERWAGVYEREHVVRLLDEKRNETVTDRLVLEPDPSGGLRFDFELWFTNAHRCAMSGVAMPKRDYFEWSDSTNAGCALRIVKVGPIVHLEDFRGACGRAGACGVRGKIDGSRLTRVSPARGR
jgi:hypothetical protein